MAFPFDRVYIVLQPLGACGECQEVEKVRSYSTYWLTKFKVLILSDEEEVKSLVVTWRKILEAKLPFFVSCSIIDTAKMAFKRALKEAGMDFVRKPTIAPLLKYTREVTDKAASMLGISANSTIYPIEVTAQLYDRKEATSFIKQKKSCDICFCEFSRNCKGE